MKEWWLVDRAGFEPATFRSLDLERFANRTFFGLNPDECQYTRLNYRPTISCPTAAHVKTLIVFLALTDNIAKTRLFWAEAFSRRNVEPT